MRGNTGLHPVRTAGTLRGATCQNDNMKCFSLLLGARNTPAAGARFSRADDETIRRITADHFPEGFTVLNADGAWFDPTNRKFVEEESRQIMVCASSRRPLRAWFEALATALRQDELLVVELGDATVLRMKRVRRDGKRRELKVSGASSETAERKRRARGAFRRRPSP